MRRTPVMLMAALALVPVSIWTLSGSASAASGSLTVTTYSRTGAKVKTPLDIVSTTTNERFSATSGKAKSLPKGTYVVLAKIYTAQGSSDTLGARVLKVSGKTSTTIDARKGKVLKPKLDKAPGADYSQEISARICSKESSAYRSEAWSSAGQVFVIPNGSKHLRFAYSSIWRPNGVAGPSYLVSGGTSKSIPAATTPTFAKSRLAPVTAVVRRGPSIGTQVDVRMEAVSGNSCREGIGALLDQWEPPFTRKVLASAGSWSLVAASMGEEAGSLAYVGHFSKTLKLTAGKPASQTFFRSAWGPGEHVPYVIYKRLTFDTSGMFRDPGFGWNNALGHEVAAKSTVTLSLGGKVLKKQNRTEWGNYDNAFFQKSLTKKGWYTLNVYATRYRPGIKAPAAMMSHKTNLRLNFYVNPKVDRQAPLILPRLAPLGLDQNNQAGRTTEVNVLLDQQRQSPDAKYIKATAKKVTAQASFDAGKTWKSVPVKKVGGTWRASVKNTKPGLVALRAKVVTTGGYTAEATIYRAYRAR